METVLLPGGSQSPESGEWEPVEKSLQEMVNKRRMKVERLERELDAYRKHYAKLFESFAVATFPEGYDLVTGDEYLNDGITSSHAAGNARVSKQRQSPSTRARHEAELANGRDIIEEAGRVPNVRNQTPSKTPSSSKSASTSMQARGFMDLTVDNEIDGTNDEIRKVRPGVKSPRKSPAKPNTISSRIPEKILKTGPGSNVDSESSDEGSSSESSDEEEAPMESSDEESSSESSDEEASGNEGSESTSEDSDESDESEPEPQIDSTKIKPSESDPEESAQGVSSSSGSDSLTEKKSSPVKVKKVLSGEKAKTTWQPKTKAPSSSSEDSEESSSSSDEDTDRNRRQAQTGRASLGRAREPEAPKAVTTSLSSDASPEELFDWIILGLQGPWPPLASVENISGASELKYQSLPLKFPSTASYTATFQKLIGEEARGIFFSEWEKFKAEQDLNSQQSLNVDSRGQLTVWRLRSMVRTTGDAFHYFEAESKQGNIKLDVGEFLCMMVPGTEEVKGVAIVYHQDRLQAPLLRTRLPWDFSLDECILLRLCNMVTLRRMFLAVTTLSEIFSPFQQQILDPLANIRFIKPPPAVEDPKLKLSLESLRNFRDRKILNTLQLLAVSSLLHMRQGFQLVQGPPGTGKTSTIVGMVSTLLIEEPGVRILVCAPSNAALDEIAARLMHGMWDKSGNVYSPIDGSIVRFGAHRVIHPIVQILSLDSLTVRLSSGSGRPRAWVDILDGASVVCATLSGCGSHTFDELEKMFDVVIIDEAAQAVEAEVLIALKRTRGRCVMVGDPQQLPATVFQRPSVAYGRSLFERFQEGGNPVHMLTTQYRMHPSICIYPSKQFYGGALANSSRTSAMQSIFSEQVCERGISVRGCSFKLGHYCFMDVGWGIEREELVGHSRANYEEALVVCNVVEGAVKGLLPGRKPNVGVITPYIAQRNDIESQLGRRGIDAAACEVNTVDGFQGREKDVIVLSCVRAMADQGLGFVSDKRRMNVALTRAKYSLIIVGHAMTLRKWSPAWDALIEDARNRGCYQDLKNNKKSTNWIQSPLPSKDLNGTRAVENTPQDSRKRSLNSTEGGRPNKKEYLKPTTDTKSNKDVNNKEDSVEARNEHAQTFSQNSKIACVEEKAGCKTTVKRKRKVFEVEAGKKNSEGLENAPNLVSAKKVREDILESSAKKAREDATEDLLGYLTVEEEVNVAANPSGFLIPPEKKKKQPKSPVLSKRKVKVETDVAEPSAPTRSPVLKQIMVKVEVDGDEPSILKRSPGLKKNMVKLEVERGEPSVTKRSPMNLKAVKPEFPTVEMRRMKTVICLPAPALTPPSRRKGRQPARPFDFRTEGNTVGTAKVPPGATTSIKEEVIFHEVMSSAPLSSGDTWRTSIDADDNGKTRTRDDSPADPIPPGTNNGRNSRGWFPNTVPEADGHIRQPLLRDVHSNLAASPTQGFGKFSEHANVDRRKPHWGNSYEAAAPGPQDRFRAHELGISTDNMYSVLTKPNNYPGRQPNIRGNLQQVPGNHWQHPNAAQTPPQGGRGRGRGRGCGRGRGRQSSNLDHRHPSGTQRHTHEWTPSDSAASAPHWKPRQGHPGDFQR